MASVASVAKLAQSNKAARPVWVCHRVLRHARVLVVGPVEGDDAKLCGEVCIEPAAVVAGLHDGGPEEIPLHL